MDATKAIANVLLIGSLTFAGSAFAVPSDPVDLNNCLDTDVTPTATDCAGYIDGTNDFLYDPLTVNTFAGGLFGGGWIFDSKVNEEGGATVLEGNGNIDITTDLPASSGEWIINNYASLVANYADALIVLKASNGFNAYYYEDFASIGIETGNWTMYTGEDRRLRDISHISLYVRGPGDPTDVPVPATLGLVLGGLFGLRRFSRRS